jgi:hypothetical protein
MSLSVVQQTRLKKLIEEFSEHVKNSSSMLYINKEEAELLDVYFNDLEAELFFEISQFRFDGDNFEFELSSNELKFIIECYYENSN